MKYDPELVKPMREEVTRLGVEELKTPEEVQEFLNDAETAMIFVNSVCGCAGSSSRPAIDMAMEHSVTPEKVGTVFAGQDDEATEYVRSLTPDIPPSSPSFFFFRNGEPVAHIPRRVSKKNDAEYVAKRLKEAFESTCEPAEEPT